jgi:hypothetical protein
LNSYDNQNNTKLGVNEDVTIQLVQTLLSPYHFDGIQNISVFSRSGIHTLIEYDIYNISFVTVCNSGNIVLWDINCMLINSEPFQTTYGGELLLKSSEQNIHVIDVQHDQYSGELIVLCHEGLLIFDNNGRCIMSIKWIDISSDVIPTCMYIIPLAVWEIHRGVLIGYNDGTVRLWGITHSSSRRFAAEYVNLIPLECMQLAFRDVMSECIHNRDILLCILAYHNLFGNQVCKSLLLLNTISQKEVISEYDCVCCMICEPLDSNISMAITAITISSNWDKIIGISDNGKIHYWPLPTSCSFNGTRNSV